MFFKRWISYKSTLIPWVDSFGWRVSVSVSLGWCKFVSHRVVSQTSFMSLAKFFWVMLSISFRVYFGGKFINPLNYCVFLLSHKPENIKYIYPTCPCFSYWLSLDCPLRITLVRYMLLDSDNKIGIWNVLRLKTTMLTIAPKTNWC